MKKERQQAEDKLANIQKILNKYKKSNEKSVFTHHFVNDTRVYVSDNQLPDLWKKTRIAFDKNKAFFFNKKSLNLNKNSYNPNIFPRIPLVIPKEEELSSLGVKVDNIPTDLLFYIESDKESTKDFLEKSWLISFCHENDLISYGPVSSAKVYLFLKNMYLPLNPDQKERKNLLIVDFENDVHFQPDSILEILQSEFSKKNYFPKNAPSKDVKGSEKIEYFSKEIDDLNFFRKIDGSNKKEKGNFAGLSSKFDLVGARKKSSISTKYSSVDSNKKGRKEKKRAHKKDVKIIN